MKKFFSATFTLIVILLTGLVSCVPQPTSEVEVSASPTIRSTKELTSKTSTPTPMVESIEVDISKLEGIQIRFLHPWTGDTQELLFQMVDQFNQTNEWGIHVIMVAPGSAGMVENKLREELANEDPSSVVVAPTSLVAALDEKEAIVVPLDPYILSPDFGLDEAMVDDFVAEFWHAEGHEGRQLGMPAQRSAMVMAYNTTWAGELGFSAVPETAEDFRKQVCAANASFRKDEDTANDGLGGWLVDKSADAMYTWLTAFGSEPFIGEGYAFSSPESEAAMLYLRGLLDDSCAWVSRRTRVEEHFTRRESLVQSIWLQELGELESVLIRSESEDEWTILPFPGVSPRLVVTDSLSYAVLHTNEEKDLAAWLFIRWMSDPVQQARLLATTGTLPLGTRVMEEMGAYVLAHPQWNQLVMDDVPLTTAPVDEDWQVVNPILGDAAWQLFTAEANPELVVDILDELDALVAELAERYP